MVLPLVILSSISEVYMYHFMTCVFSPYLSGSPYIRVSTHPLPFSLASGVASSSSMGLRGQSSLFGL